MLTTHTTQIRCSQHIYDTNYMFSTPLWHKPQTYNTLTSITRPYSFDTNRRFITHFWHKLQAYNTSNTNLRSLYIRHQSQVFQHISDTNHMLTTHSLLQSHASNTLMIRIAGTHHTSDTNHSIQHFNTNRRFLHFWHILPTRMCPLITHFWHQLQACNTLLTPITHSYPTSDTNHMFLSHFWHQSPYTVSETNHSS